MNDVVGCIDFFGLLFASFVFVCVRIQCEVMSINIPNNKRQYVVAEEVRHRRVVTSAANAMWRNVDVVDVQLLAIGYRK